MNYKVLEITKLCNTIRKALEEMQPSNDLFKDFPLGCCRDTSLLLDLFLKEYEYMDVIFCSKDIDDISPSHAWLEWQDLIIDITADQLRFDLPKIIVVPVIDADSFYKSNRRELADLNIAGIDAVRILEEFERIKKYLTFNQFK